MLFGRRGIGEHDYELQVVLTRYDGSHRPPRTLSLVKEAVELVSQQPPQLTVGNCVHSAGVNRERLQRSPGEIRPALDEFIDHVVREMQTEPHASKCMANGLGNPPSRIMPSLR